MPRSAPNKAPYTNEQAEEDIAGLRNQTSVMSEAFTQNDTSVLPPNTPTQGNIQYSSSGHKMYVSSDTGVYNTGRNTVYCVHDGNVVNSTSQVLIGQMGPINVGVGWYLVVGAIFCSNGSTTATQAIRFTSTATIANMALGWQSFEGGGVLSSGVAAAVTDDMSWASIPNGTTGELNIHGAVQFSSTGQVQLAQRCVTSGSDTFHIALGSVLSVCPITTPQGS